MRLPWHAQLQVDEASPPTRSAGLVRSRARRRIAAIGVVVLMLALPVAVSASHIFSDVPTSNTFHASISTLYGARITGGCGGGKYCPNAAVTRGSMAAFLVRGLGRMATTFDGDADDWVTIMPDPPLAGQPHPFGSVANLNFRHGGGVGGTALVFATGTVQVSTPETGVCPCEVQGFLFNDTTGETSPLFFDMVASEQAPADPDLSIDPPPPPFDPNAQYAEMTMTMSYAFSVDSGIVNTYGIALKVIPTTDPTVDDTDGLLTGWAASLQTVYVPFDADGQNPPSFSTQGNGLPRNPRKAAN